MTVPRWVDYFGVFVVTGLMALLLTPIALRLALRRQIVDLPNEIKAQESPVPYLGGAAILLSFVLVVGVAALARRPEGGPGELLMILGLGALLAVMGLADDLRGLSPWVRLAVEIGVACAVVATSVGSELFHNDVLDLVVTVVWIVGVTNAFNLLDNMDGLSAGVAAIASFFLFALAARNGQFLVATLAIALAGCAVGFLRSNFHPARIYMGDAGSLFLGFMLAVLSMKIELVDAPRSVALAVPIVLLGVPLFDTTLVTVNRILHDRSPLSGGRDHTSHRLVFVGIPVPAAVTLIYLGAISLGWLSLVLAELDEGTGLLLVGWIAVVALGLSVLLSLVPVYESSRRRRLMILEVAKHVDDSLDDRDETA